MDELILKRIDEWQGEEYDEATRREISGLVIKKDERELTDRFYAELEFGTAGLRGTLGAGSNRMNIYVVRKATQGLANYILKQGPGISGRGVLVGRDSRIMSDAFAMETASVLIANGIRVYYYEDIHPTPTVSFGVRRLNAISGVMITASHNPKEYNGYKVVWEDGAQITPPHDSEIIKEVRAISSLKQVKHIDASEIRKNPLFSIADGLVDGDYLSKVKSLSIHPEIIQSSGVKICYSPLYGTGYRLVPESLKNFGFKNIEIVKEQAVPDGNFPTAPYPNPEEPEAMAVGMKYAKESGADVFIATDPDADRLGVMLKKEKGDYVLLNGNQIATLLGFYIMSELYETGKMPSNPRIIKTIVTTDTLPAIAKTYGIETDEVLTGFKWIGAKLKEYEKSGYNYVFGGEESHGYSAGTFVRDKDAVISGSMFAELVAFYLSKGLSAYRVLENIYERFGFFSESQQSVTLKGRDGAMQIKALMEKLRKTPPEKISRYKVLEVIDLESYKNGKWQLPKSDVVILKLSDNAKVIARPSGTEPKIKFYFTTFGKLTGGSKDINGLMETVKAAHEELKAGFLTDMGLRA
ncbi:MAG: phospho-sugar mutase [Brevinematales bacterium]|jgi:phosphoglucomutase